ncbi:MAG: glycosyltransferase family 4 protein [Ornithinimicrobium sp.]
MRVPLWPVTLLPAHGGRVGRRALLVQAAHLRGIGRPNEALRLLRGVPDGSLPPHGHSVRARAWEDLGALDRALASAQTATSGGNVEVPALLVRLRIARALNDARAVEECLRLAAFAQPRNVREADTLARAFRSDDVHIVQRFCDAVDTWSYHPSRSELLRIDTDRLLAGGASEQDLAERACREAASSATGLDDAVLRLSARQNWAVLAHVVSGRRVDAPVAKALSRYASQALKAGQADHATAIAETAIRSGTGMNLARSVHARASEQHLIARSGWPEPPVHARSYTPDARATVSVLAQSLPHRSGGYATRSHGLLTGLRAHGWQPRAVTRLGFPYDRWPSRSSEEVPDVDVVDGIGYHRLLEPGERVYSTSPLSSYIERFAGRVADHAREHQAGLIHAASFQNNGLAGVTAARRLGIPFVYEMRGLEDLMKVSRDPGFASTTAYRAMTTLENHIVSHADLTFVITEALRVEMIRRGAPEDRVEVLPNGVHTSDFEPRERDEDLVDSLGVRGRTVVGYAGGLVDYEGLDLLLEATAELASRRHDFAVVIVGDGHVSARLMRQAAELGIEDLVVFTGRVGHHEVARYLSIFDITPFPRHPLPVCELISPIKPFEAMSMGKAVVVSSVAALTEIVEPDLRGLVFDKGDHRDLAAQLERYLDSPGLRSAMGDNARRWVLAERDWSDVVEVVDAAYHRLLGGVVRG